jgi:hypothetical protein
MGFRLKDSYIPLLKLPAFRKIFLRIEKCANIQMVGLLKAEERDSRLTSRLGRSGAAVSAMKVLKTVLREAYFRELMPTDPTAGIGSVRNEKKETKYSSDEDFVFARQFPCKGILPGNFVYCRNAMGNICAGDNMEDKRNILKDQHPFEYKLIKDEKAQILFKGRVIKILHGKEFNKLQKVINLEDSYQLQLFLAKVTGQFKHGNEKSLQKSIT